MAFKIILDLEKRIGMMVNQNDGSLISNQDLRSLLNLSTRSWFSRTWVLQKAFLAQDAWVHCGDKRLHLSSILNMRTKLRDRTEVYTNQETRLSDLEWRLPDCNTIDEVFNERCLEEFTTLPISIIQ
jgi:hypothetical protein